MPPHSLIDPAEELHISSLVVHCRPEHMAALVETLSQNNEVEIAASEDHSGKIVLLIEAPSMQATCERVDHIKTLTGVINVSIVYHHAEARRSLEEDLA